MSCGRHSASVTAGGAERARVAASGSRGRSRGWLVRLATGRILRADEVTELRVGKVGVAVGVDAPNDSKKFGLAGIVAHVSQESAEV